VEFEVIAIPAEFRSQTPVLLAVWNTVVAPRLIVQSPVQKILTIEIAETVSTDVFGEAKSVKLYVVFAVSSVVTWPALRLLMMAITD
jgi:hypothetical protein